MKPNWSIYTSLTVAFVIIVAGIGLIGCTNDLSGWTEINRNWPSNEKEFFIVTSKGHHSIDVRLSNIKKLSRNLDLHFEYYYSYEKTEPIISLVPCRSTIDVLGSRSSQIPGQADRTWLKHSQQIKLEDCLARPELTYHVILHDEGDVFAWRLMRLDTRPTEGGRSDLSDEKKVTDEGATRPESSQEQDAPSYPETLEKPDSGNSPYRTDRDSKDEETIKPGPIYPKDDPRNERSKRAALSSSDSRREWPGAVGFFRSAADHRHERSIETGEESLICRPSLCRRDLFNFPDFMVFTRSIPAVKQEDFDSGMKYYLDTTKKPLKLTLNTVENPSSVNLCFETMIYMDPETELDLKLNGLTAGSSELLETIERKSTDSTAGKWDELKRCVSDYVPQLPPIDDNKLSIEFVPHYKQPESQIAMLVNPERAISEKVRHPLHDFIPDLNRLQDLESFDNYWIVDRDGAVKVDLELEMDQKTGSQKLHMKSIDSTQDSFDITSRWLKLEDMDKLENPLVFFYRGSVEDWIESIDFEYQRAGSASASWISQRIYEAPVKRVEASTEASPQQVDTSSPSSTALAPTKQDTILPVKLRMKAGEYRIRLRHNLKKSALGLPLSLQLSNLALGDICVAGKYCKNAGTCVPVGLTTGQCSCAQGYYGKTCEIVKPCEVLIDGRTGEQLCKSLGAVCVTNLPVLRCKWPNDQYYRCTSLFQHNSNPETINPVPRPSSDGSIEDLPLPEQVQAWKDLYNKQSRSIIIMVVFLIAMLLFSAVIVGNMVLRVMKSKKKLKSAENEMQDLAYRLQPTTSAPTRVGPGRLGSGPMKYNNQAFDVE